MRTGHAPTTPDTPLSARAFYFLDQCCNRLAGFLWKQAQKRDPIWSKEPLPDVGRDEGFNHGFPRIVNQGDTCPRCEGSGEHNGKPCAICNGTGVFTEAMARPTCGQPERDREVLRQDVLQFLEQFGCHRDAYFQGVKRRQEGFYNLGDVLIEYGLRVYQHPHAITPQEDPAPAPQAPKPE